MATFDEGGGWGDDSSCSTAHTQLINNALTSIQAILTRWNLPCLTGLRDDLQDFLNCSLEINCEDCDIAGKAGRGSGEITICEDFMDGATQAQVTAVVFHEMVHAAGGTELDAEAIENHFLGGAGASAPTAGDFPKFRDDEGEFVIWDEDSGQVFEKCIDEGSWNEGDTVTQGVQLSVNFVDSSGGDGGWV